jgi:hypothetical protein
MRLLNARAIYRACRLRHALSILLHTWLVFLLYRLDMKPDELRVLPPQSDLS